MTAQAQETDLTARLAVWTGKQGIKPADTPEALADRVIASLGEWRVEEWLDAGGTDYLRATAARYASPEEPGLERWAAEDYYHGHGGKPPKGRKRRSGNG